MSILGDVENVVTTPFKWIGGEAKTIIQTLVPPDLEAKIGLFATTFASNMYHDFGALAATLTHEVVANVWATLETAAKNLIPQVLAGKVTVGGAIAAGVAALKSDAASTLLPALAQTSEATISTWLAPLITTALNAASANPMSPQASSQAGSSSAASQPSSAPSDAAKKGS